MIEKRLLIAALALFVTACPGVKTKLCGAVNQPCCSSGTACETGNTCDAAQTCVACGAAGQTCCPGSSCASGAVCGTTNRCAPCGGSGQPCCAQNSCQTGLSCAGQTCTAGCGVTCTLGESRCSGTGGIESCATGAMCPQWQAVIATCPGGTSCMVTAAQADCVQLCAVSCTPDALQCATTGLERCVLANGASCPTLATEPDDTTYPQCVTGAQDGTSLVWESPAPLGAPLVAISGDFAFSYWVLDSEGNILHNDLGSWKYELRATEGKRALALASCGAGSYLYAVGQAGTVYVRSGGAWQEENAGTTADLDTVACDSALTAYAAGADGKLYIRTNGWVSYPTGFIGNVAGLGYAFSYLKLALVGDGGKIVGCDITSLPPACVSQASGTTANLRAAWGDTFLGHLYAAGDNGTLLEWNGTQWSALDTKGSTKTLRAVSGYYDSAGNKTVIIAVGDDGAYFSRPTPLIEAYPDAPNEKLTAVLAVDGANIFVTSLEGAVWFNDQPSPPAGITMVARGGKKPIAGVQLTAASTLGQGRLFVVGRSGARYRRENATWLDDRAGLAVSEDLNAVAAVGSGEVYAAGNGGRLLVRRFGTWFDDAPGLVTENLQGVAFDPSTIYAVGAGGTWLEKPRSGGTWTKIDHGATTANLWGLAVNVDTIGHTQEVVAVGDNCTVLSKKDGAFTVLPIPACPGTSPIFAAAYSGGDLYVAGDPALVLHRSGTGWTREFISTTSLEAITSLVPQGSTLWALTTSGGAYERIASWAQFEPDLAPNDLFGGVFDPDLGLFIVGDNGLIWRKP